MCPNGTWRKSQAYTGWMFYGGCVFNGDLSKWNVDRVTSMAAMFRQAPVFNGDEYLDLFPFGDCSDSSHVVLGELDVSRVTDMGELFSGATFF